MPVGRTNPWKRSNLLDVIKLSWLQQVVVGGVVGIAFDVLRGRLGTDGHYFRPSDLFTHSAEGTVILPTFAGAGVDCRGVAYTVFEGVNPEPMEVEILGVAKECDRGPGRGHDPGAAAPAQSRSTQGVVAGMSGSPVYIDGKLIGCAQLTGLDSSARSPSQVSRRFEEMLEVRDGQRPLRPDTGSTAADEWQAARQMKPIETGAGLWRVFSQEDD